MLVYSWPKQMIIDLSIDKGAVQVVAAAENGKVGMRIFEGDIDQSFHPLVPIEKYSPEELENIKSKMQTIEGLNV